METQNFLAFAENRDRKSQKSPTLAAKRKKRSRKTSSQKDAAPAVGAPKDDQKRLVGQNKRIWDLLCQGKVKNTRLRDVGFNYTARISNIRAWMKTEHPTKKIQCKKLSGGVTEYELVEKQS